jgi:hypothetical protein
VIALIKQKLPCGEKNCRSKMALINNSPDYLHYRCLEKPEEHSFRYSINQKKWEKLVIKAKLLLNYDINPCEETSIYNANIAYDFERHIQNQFHGVTYTSNLTEVKGIGSKRAKELELAGVKTVADLAKLSPKSLSEKTGIPIAIISNWIIEANKLTKTAIKIAP